MLLPMKCDDIICPGICDSCVHITRFRKAHGSHICALEGRVFCQRLQVFMLPYDSCNCFHCFTLPHPESGLRTEVWNVVLLAEVAGEWKALPLYEPIPGIIEKIDSLPKWVPQPLEHVDVKLRIGDIDGQD